MRTDYERIFLGASCFALGCAAQRPQDTLIVESGEGFGGEFVDALRADARPIVRPQGAGAAFYDELLSRGILDEESAAQGRIHLPAVNVVLNRWAIERRTAMLLRTRVFAVRRDGEGYALQAVCNARVLTLTCRRLIDTRSNDFARLRRLDPHARVALGANLHMEALPDTPLPGLSVCRGYLPGEAYAHLTLTGTEENAREALLSAFERRPAAWLPARLLTVCHAAAVWCAPIRERTQNGLYVPGCGFDNPVAAFAAGLAEEEATK